MNPPELVEHDNLIKLVYQYRLEIRRRRVGAVLRSVQRSTQVGGGNGLHNQASYVDSGTDAKNALSRLLQLSDVCVPIEDDLPLPPRGKSFSRIGNNLMPPTIYPDDAYVPYLGEETNDVQKMEQIAGLLNNQQHNEGTEKQKTEVEVSRVLEEVRTSKFASVVESHITEQAHKYETQSCFLPWDKRVHSNDTAWNRKKWDRIANKICVFRCAHAIGVDKWRSVSDFVCRILGITSETALELLANALYNDNAWKVEDVLVKQQNQILESIRSEKGDNMERILRSNSIPYFWCRQCSIFDCGLHGPNQLCHEVTMIPFEFQVANDESRKKCLWAFSETCPHSCVFTRTGKCCLLGNAPRREFRNRLSSIPLELKRIIDLIREVYGEDPCRIASCVSWLSNTNDSILCADVRNYIKSNPEPFVPIRSQQLSRKTPRAKWYMSKQEQDCMKAGIRQNYTPCRHEGKCTVENGCSCVISGVHCEKYCKCLSPRVSGNRTHKGTSCYNLFPFCSGENKSCRTGCTTTSCNCFGAYRECDPDFCKCTCCQNQSLRRRQLAKIVCGNSQIHGFGAFATAVIQEGQLVVEYTGEHLDLDSDVTETKEQVYFVMGSSYLFDLTTTHWLDATRIGNKARYINHSTNGNLYPRTLKVDGDIRLALYAIRRIEPGEELLYNYGERFLCSKDNRIRSQSENPASASSSGSEPINPAEAPEVIVVDD